MINRCRFLNIGLNLCSQIGQSCPYMTDPSPCPDYDEDFDRSYVENYRMAKLKGDDLIKAENKRLSTKTIYSAPGLSGDIEDAKAFTSRVEAELNGMGVKVEKTEEIVEEEAPEWF
ncbi:hypothetical protein KKF82_08040 [Patescibacteria group bacterium]|uniref:Uncharacterized protein n=1 Tax=viral metagenome TaxID=1070528 RepID=A0A6M3M649_9ZZZZ|nr:hypothetical protein [Patescibacteria group bacterium]